MPTFAGRRRFARDAAAGAAVAVALAAACVVPSSGAAAGPDAGPIGTVALDVPAGADPSEPHLAADPANPHRLFAVAQTVTPEDYPFTKELLWRSVDGGRSWARSPVLGGPDNSPADFAGDPTVAAGSGRRVLYGTLTFALDPVAGTAAQHVGTRVSTDGGASFSAFGTAGLGGFPLCLFSGTCQEPPPADVQFVDKPWLAVDTSGGRFDGSVYLSWVRARLDGTQDLLLAVSRDGGVTYESPVVLQHARTEELDPLEELVQLAVRPDGTVDAVWNGIRHGRPLVLHASSTDGGRTFTAPHVAVHLRAGANLEGIVLSLAVSRRGRLGLCWSQALSAGVYDARVACKRTNRSGRWGPAREPLPNPASRQYLPAAAFAGEHLWVVAYLSGPTTTRVVAARGDRRGGRAVELAESPVPASRICAPHPPDCQEGQTFIGDYIGLVGAPGRLTAAYIEPSVDADHVNRVLVTAIRYRHRGYEQGRR